MLPINRSSNVLVLGQAAKEIKYQTGGWSMTWQGNENENSDFPGSTTILAAIENEFEYSQGSVTFSENLEYGELKPDVAILVIAEDPYAEYQGTLQDLVYNSSENHLDWLVALKEDEIPVVTIFLSGRPLWMNREINLSDAFVAAWLPGTEGGGVSDMIIENEYDFVGSLTFSWPKRSDQATLNYDDEIYDPLFPVGYGLSYKDDITIDQLEESINLTEESDFNAPILNGWPRNAFQVILGNTDETLEMKSKFVATTDESVSAEMINRFVQEDAYRIMFSGNDDSFWKVSSTKPMNWSEEASQSGVLTMNIRILQADMIKPLIVSTLCGEGCGSSFEIEGSMNKNQWINIGVDITCMGQNGLELSNINEPVQIKSNGKWEFEVGEIKLIGGTGGTSIMICPNNKN